MNEYTREQLMSFEFPIEQLPKDCSVTMAMEDDSDILRSSYWDGRSVGMFVRTILIVDTTSGTQVEIEHEHWKLTEEKVAQGLITRRWCRYMNGGYVDLIPQAERDARAQEEREKLLKWVSQSAKEFPGQYVALYYRYLMPRTAAFDDLDSAWGFAYYESDAGEMSFVGIARDGEIVIDRDRLWDYKDTIHD